jgi:hypothetical protein
MMGVYCGECRNAVECGSHPERFMDCQDNAARFGITAAAPDMYAALETVVQAFRDSSGVPTTMNPGWEVAREALAKASGE